MKQKLHFSQRGFPQKRPVFTGFNPLVEVLLLQLVTAANSLVSNPPLSDWRSHTSTQPSGHSVLQQGGRGTGAGSRHPPHLFSSPWWLPVFFSPSLLLSVCRGNKRKETFKK